MLNKKGFTLVELMISITILAISFAGIFTFISQYLNTLNSTQNTSIALAGAQEQLERIKSLTSRTNESTKISFDLLPGEYNNQTFNILDQTGTILANFKGRIYLTTKFSTAPVVYRIKIVVCFRNQGNRVFGEDTNLNGQLDAGEDTDGNNEIDSPITLITDFVSMQ